MKPPNLNPQSVSWLRPWTFLTDVVRKLSGSILPVERRAGVKCCTRKGKLVNQGCNMHSNDP